MDSSLENKFHDMLTAQHEKGFFWFNTEGLYYVPVKEAESAKGAAILPLAPQPSMEVGQRPHGAGILPATGRTQNQQTQKPSPAGAEAEMCAEAGESG